MEKVFVGQDWAEAHHDVCVEDAEGRRLGGGRVPEGVEGVARFHELVAAHAEDPAEVVIATETDRGLFVAALVAAGYGVLAVNPMSTSRYRERHSTSGAKSDPGDALGAGRTGPHRWPQPPARRRRQRPGRSDQGPGPGPPGVDLDAATSAQPAALDAAGVLPGRPRGVPCAGPARRLGRARRLRRHPTQGRRLSRSKIASALRRGGRQRRIEERAVEIQAALRTEQLTAAVVVADAMGSASPGPGRGDRRAHRPDRRPRRPSWPTVLTSTRTPRSSDPCQDWG